MDHLPLVIALLAALAASGCQRERAVPAPPEPSTQVPVRLEMLPPSPAVQLPAIAPSASPQPQGALDQAIAAAASAQSLFQRREYIIDSGADRDSLKK